MKTHDKSITDYLAIKGIYPKKKSGHNWFYLSPIRNETDASFCVNTSRNQWYDFGNGEGGGIVKLVNMMDGDTMEQTERRLARMTIPYQLKKEEPPTLIIQGTKRIRNAFLIEVLLERKINPDIARIYCEEVEYTLKGKPKIAIGFKNNGGGYELRTKKMKISSRPKDITTIPGLETQNIFEGFMDFLSLLTIFRAEKFKNTTHVLNGVAQKTKIPNHKAVLFIDNDPSGLDTAKYFKSRFECIEAMPYYGDCKDINDILCKGNPTEFKAKIKKLL